MSGDKTGLRRHLTYANVMATIAVFGVLGGGAYATHTHKMGTQDLQNRAVTAPKIANNAVIPRTIRQNAVRSFELRGNSVRTWHIFGGAVGTHELDDGAVNSAKVEDGSLTGEDIDQATLDDVDAARLGDNAPGDFGAGLMTGRIDRGWFDSSTFAAPSGRLTGRPNVSDVWTLSPATAIVARDLQVSGQGDIAVPLGGTVTLLVDNGPSGLTCTIPPEEEECTSSGSVLVPPGSKLSIQTSGPFGHFDDLLFGWRATMP